MPTNYALINTFYVRSICYNMQNTTQTYFNNITTEYIIDEIQVTFINNSNSQVASIHACLPLRICATWGKTTTHGCSGSYDVWTRDLPRPICDEDIFKWCSFVSGSCDESSLLLAEYTFMKQLSISSQCVFNTTVDLATVRLHGHFFFIFDIYLYKGSYNLCTMRLLPTSFYCFLACYMMPCNRTICWGNCFCMGQRLASFGIYSPFCILRLCYCSWLNMWRDLS